MNILAIIVEYKDRYNVHIVRTLYSPDIDTCKRDFSSYIKWHLDSCPEIMKYQSEYGTIYGINPLYEKNSNKSRDLFYNSETDNPFPYLPLLNPYNSSILLIEQGTGRGRECTPIQTEYQDKYGKWKLIVLT